MGLLLILFLLLLGWGAFTIHPVLGIILVIYALVQLAAFSDDAKRNPVGKRSVWW